MESNAENVNVKHTEYRSKVVQTKFDKHLVVVKVTSPYQKAAKRPFSKSEDETTQFRETIQKYMEQMLVRLGDVKIVENDIQSAWSHFIQIVFKIFYRPRENGTHLTFAKIGVCIYSQDHAGVVGFHNPIAEPTLDQLDEFCKNIVIDFTGSSFNHNARTNNTVWKPKNLYHSQSLEFSGRTRGMRAVWDNMANTFEWK